MTLFIGCVMILGDGCFRVFREHSFEDWIRVILRLEVKFIERF